MRPRVSIRRDERDRGTSVVELVMYMPFLVFMIFLTLQVAFLFLGNQAAGAAAREAARVARSAGDPAAGSDAALLAGQLHGQEYAASVGKGLLTDVTVQVEDVNGPNGPEVRATVKGKGVQLVPGMPGASISQVVLGPLEVFRPDPGV